MKKPNELKVPLQTGAATTALVYAAAEDAAVASDAALILGHGAGAGQRSTFMVDFARALSALGIDVVTFNFLYTEQGRRIPDRAPVLEACYRAVIDAVRAEVDERAPVAVHRRQVDGRPHRDAGRGRGSRRSRSPVSCCSATRCIRPGSRPSAATSTCRRSRARCSSCRAAATRSARRTNWRRSSARCGRAPTLHVAAQGDHSFKLRAEGSGGTGRGLRRASAGHRSLDTFSSMTSPPCEKPWRR